MNNHHEHSRHSRRTWQLSSVAVAATLALAVSACSSSASDSGSDNTGSSGSGTSAAPKVWSDDASLLAAAKAEGAVNLYMPAEQTATIDGFEKAFPWAKVNVTDLIPDDAATRWATELGSNVHNADVINLYVTQLEQFESQNAMASVQVPNDANVPSEDQDANHLYHTWYVAPYVFLYNTAQLDDPPTDLKDLADPKWSNQLVIDNPTVGGPSAMVFAAEKQLLGDDWQDWLHGVESNNPMLVDGSGTSYGDVVRGDRPLCICAYHDFTSQDSGTPVEAAFYNQSSTGVAAQQLTMSIDVQAPHPAMAALFVNWLLSTDGQSSVVEGGRSPADSSVPGADKVSLPADTKIAGPDVLGDFITDQAPYIEVYKDVFGG